VVEQDSQFVTWVIDLTPCRTATITVPTQPEDITLDRSETIGNTLEFTVTPTYSRFLVNSQPTHCPYLKYELQDNNGVKMESQTVRMTGADTPAQAKLFVKNDVPVIAPIRIKAWTMSKDNFVQFSIRVCGTETLTLVESTPKTYITNSETRSFLDITPAERYLTIPESTFGAFFNH